jgi:AmmeMemoRadiSam system protein A
MTCEEDRQTLLRIARSAIEAYVTGSTVPLVEADGMLARRAGVFVTLHSRGVLRGCIGHIESDLPLAHGVARCAVAASSSDPRFPAVTREELPGLALEISILSALEPAASLKEIEVGRHGLVVEGNGQTGLLLPQVATEWHWDANTFVAQTCLKAGLVPDAWPEAARLWRFEAEVFSEGAYITREP